MNSIEKFGSGPAQLTMSSIEIAERCKKVHKNVVRDIRNLVVSLYCKTNEAKDGSELIHPPEQLNGPSIGLFSDGSPINTNQDEKDFQLEKLKVDGVKVMLDTRGYVSEILLDKNHTLTLVTGYDPVLRMGIIQRWQELEAKAANPYADMLPKNFSEAVQMLACTLKENEALQDKKNELEKDLSIADPKAKALDRIANTDGTFCVTQAAKGLGVQPKALFAYFKSNKWTYKRNGGVNAAYQDKIIRGLLVHKTTIVTRADGTEKVCDQVRVTGKGLAQLAVVFNQKSGV